MTILKKINHDLPKVLCPKAGQLIALTGGIGSGKSFVLDFLKKLGFEICDADMLIHNLLNKNGGLAYKEVATLFPEVVTKDGIERKILGDIVLKDPAKLSKLEAILHPKLRDAQREFTSNIMKNSGKSIVFEVPLLFENHREGNYDYVITTITTPNLQKRRALQRNNMTKSKFDAIIKKQVSNKIRLKLAHFVINTGLTKLDTKRQIRAIVKNGNFKRNSIRYRNHRLIRT